MPKEPKREPTKGTRRAYLFARLSGWFFLGAVFASTLHINSGPIADYLSTAFFILSILSLFIICPVLMIMGNPKRSTEHQTGINGLVMGIVGLAVLGLCIAQCAA